MAGPTSITPTDGTWIIHGHVTSPYPAAPITASNGTWIIHGHVTSPYPAAPITPTNGTWIIVIDGARPSFRYGLGFGAPGKGFS